jgi:hypothetical protein
MDLPCDASKTFLMCQSLEIAQLSRSHYKVGAIHRFEGYILLDTMRGFSANMYALLHLLLVAATAAFTFDELFLMQNSLWDHFLYPANLQQINATDTSVFAEDVCLLPDLLFLSVPTPSDLTLHLHRSRAA